MPGETGSLAACCVSQCAIDSFVSRSQSCRPRRVTHQQAFNPPPACFAASLLASLAISQIPTPATNLAETPPLKVCPAKVGPRYLVFHQHLSWVSGYHLRGSLHSDLNVERIVTAIRGTARIPSILSGSHLSDSGILLMFAVRVLIAIPCSVTTTASDDEFSIPTNTPGWNRGSHFHPVAGLAGMYRIFSQNSRMGVLFLRPCSLCSGVFPSLPMSHLFIRYAANSTNQHCIFASGGILVPVRCSNAAFNVLAWPAMSPTARSMTPLDWLSPTGGLSGTVWLPSWRDCAISLANASIAGSLSHLSVTVLCPS